MKQPTLSWPTKRNEGEKREEERVTEKRQDDQGKWVKRGGEEDKQRYRAFLLYCEDKRQESRLRQEEDEERKRRAKRREKQWELMQISIEYLKKNETKWRTRKIENVRG